ncbi:hypothetical protein ACTID9_13770 [Brevibacillus fluminis]|uniref:hypothetical protein n=1 Tax=Brevibacillus fluminis TaxID=511487 RepID=UPI003F8A70A2
MEKKRKQESSHWTIPGVFYGEVEAMDAVQRVPAVVAQQEEWTGGAAHPVMETAKSEEMAALVAEVALLKDTLKQFEDRLKVVQLEHKRERERLYQMVLLLKQEWERARDEHRYR